MATQAVPRRTSADPRAADRGALLRAVSAELSEGRRTSIGRARLHRELAARGLRPSELVPLAFCDPGTGLGDRWAFARDLDALLAGPEDDRGAVVVALSLGEPAAAGAPGPGEVAAALCRWLRATDLAAPLPGGRYAVLLPGCAAAGGAIVAERLRRALGVPDLCAAVLDVAAAPRALGLARAAAPPARGARDGRGRGGADRA